VHHLAPIVGETVASRLAPAEAFSILLRDVADAMHDGTSRAEDPFTTATALWAALHGLIMLRARIPRFPWPPPGPLEDEIISRLAFPPGPTTA
jgi:hypothetical protein